MVFRKNTSGTDTDRRQQLCTVTNKNLCVPNDTGHKINAFTHSAQTNSIPSMTVSRLQTAMRKKWNFHFALLKFLEHNLASFYRCKQSTEAFRLHALIVVPENMPYIIMHSLWLPVRYHQILNERVGARKHDILYHILKQRANTCP